MGFTSTICKAAAITIHLDQRHYFGFSDLDPRDGGQSQNPMQTVLGHVQLIGNVPQFGYFLVFANCRIAVERFRNVGSCTCLCTCLLGLFDYSSLTVCTLNPPIVFKIMCFGFWTYLFMMMVMHVWIPDKQTHCKEQNCANEGRLKAVPHSKLFAILLSGLQLKSQGSL